MSIRDFRKHLKPVIWVITILMVISGFVYAWSTFSTPQQRYAAKINDEKLTFAAVERTKMAYNEQLTRSGLTKVDNGTIDLLSFNESVNKLLTENMAKDAKIKVSSSDIDKAYKARESAITAQGGIFDEWLKMRGYTRATYKLDIESDLKMEKFLTQLKDNAKVPSDDEIKKVYDENIHQFQGKKLEEVKDAIVDNLKQVSAEKEYFTLLEKARKNMKITDMDKSYEAFQEKEAINENGFSISNVILAQTVLRTLGYTGGDKDKAEEMAKKMLEAETKIAKIAKDKGVVVDENLPINMQLSEYQTGLFDKIRADIKPTDEELQNFFKENQKLYDTHASAIANIALMVIEYSDADKAACKVEAEKILKEVTPENFAELAKKYSEDKASAVNGGDLGSFSKEEMVPSFSEAVFKGEIGKVYPQLVESQFGYHIIFIKERNETKASASHILIMPKLSKETIAKAETVSKDVVKKLTDKEVTFDKVRELDSKIQGPGQFPGITPDGTIPRLLQDKALTDDIYSANLNEFKYKIIENRCFFFEKTNEVKAKTAVYDDFKDVVKTDYINQNAQKELTKLY